MSKKLQLVAFDENNKKHINAFEYFAHETGHPEYLVNGVIEDADLGFREFLSTKFNLRSCFIEDPNGSHHELITRTGDQAVFNGWYCTEDDQDGYDEIGFEFSGKLFFNLKTEKVILEPDVNSIKMITEIL